MTFPRPDTAITVPSAGAPAAPDEGGDRSRTVVIGAGPAGLTAALMLVRAGRRPLVLEASGQVGGISRTVERDGWRFDLGGHRFFTKVDEVARLWHEILPDGDFLRRPRKSRILYRGRLFDYPLRPANALRNLGPFEAARCVASYAAARVRPPRTQDTFEDWVAARFGRRLYGIFFKTYTEKVWGVPGSQIQADWAAQRIKNLSSPRRYATRCAQAAPENDHHADRRIRIPAPGPRHDVGGAPGPGTGRRWRDPDAHAGDQPRTRGRPGEERAGARPRRPDPDARVRPGRSPRCRSRAGAGHGPAAARRRRRDAGCGTATS